MTRTISSFAIVICLSAAPASADLSAQDVWADWQGYAAAFGLEIEGTEIPVADGLLVQDIAIDGNLGDGSALSLSLEEVRFSETETGAVRILLPDEIATRTSTTLPDGTSSNTSVIYTHVGLETQATGEVADLVYSFTAESMSAISDTRLRRPGDTTDVPGAQVEFSIAEVSGTNTVAVDAVRTLSQDVEASRLSYAVEYADAGTGVNTVLTGAADTLSMTGESVLPVLVMPQIDMVGLLDAGFQSGAEFRVGPNSLEVNISGPDGPLDARFTSTAGKVTTRLGADGLTYDFLQETVTADVAGDMVPLPLSFAVAQSSVTLKMPVLPDETAQSFSLGFALEGVEFPDTLWQVFDPTEALPRSPATVALTFGGTARLNRNIFALDYTGPMPGVPAADFETLTIDRLDVALAGARLTGTGAFRFAEATDDTVPVAPEGAADFTLSGANTLLDTLVGIGLITQQDATGARMMMGLMARPGDAPDTLVSRIEITEGFEVYANGQRIR